MNKTLVVGFKGNKNSAKVLLDNLNPNIKKIYLNNDFDKCKKGFSAYDLSYFLRRYLRRDSILYNKLKIK